MDTRLYRLRAQVWLTPVIGIESPVIKIDFNQQRIFDGALTHPRCFDIDCELPAGVQTLQIKFDNKTIENSLPGTDMAVIIDRVVFNDIESPKFAWAGVYEPRYPEPWASEQQALGQILEPKLTNHTYLGWNGTWSLQFTTPIFTWIHQLQSLGWIYQ